jgi:hypothetical protein
MKKGDSLRALALLTLIAAALAGLIVLSVNQPLREALGESLGWFRGWAWGPVVFAAVYALARLVLPGSLITLAAGSLFGVLVGTAGLIRAAGTAGLGGRVALVEREFLGGDCLNVGCVPSKALIRARGPPPRSRAHTTMASRCQPAPRWRPWWRGTQAR